MQGSTAWARGSQRYLHGLPDGAGICTSDGREIERQLDKLAAQRWATGLRPERRGGGEAAGLEWRDPSPSELHVVKANGMPWELQFSQGRVPGNYGDGGEGREGKVIAVAQGKGEGVALAVFHNRVRDGLNAAHDV